MAEALRHKIYHHLKDEAQRFFLHASKILSDAEQISLAKGYEGEFVSQRDKA